MSQSAARIDHSFLITGQWAAILPPSTWLRKPQSIILPFCPACPDILPVSDLSVAFTFKFCHLLTIISFLEALFI